MYVRRLALIGLLAGTLAGCDALNQGELVPSPEAGPTAAADSVGQESSASTPPAGSAAPAGVVAPAPSEGDPAADASAGEAAESTATGDDGDDGSDEAAPAADASGTAADAGGAAPAAGSLPGDMLTDAEAQRAESLALQSVAVKELVGTAADRDAVLQAASRGDDAAEALSALAEQPSYRVIYSQRYAEKGGSGRAAEVAIHRYDTGTTSYAKVDLATGEVEALVAPAGLPVPIVAEEITEAATIARADDAVRAKLEAAGLDPDAAMANALITVPLDREAVCARHRCLRLFFGSLRQPVPTFSVIVDMVALDVVEVADMPGEGSNP